MCVHWLYTHSHTSRYCCLEFLRHDSCLLELSRGSKRPSRKAPTHLLGQILPSEDFISPIVGCHQGAFLTFIGNSGLIVIMNSRIDMKNFVAFMNSTELWKKQRRAMNVSLNKHAVIGFRAAQEHQTRKLLQRNSCEQLESFGPSQWGIPQVYSAFVYVRDHP